MITTCLLYHIGDEFGRDGGSTFVLFILPCIWEKRYNSSNSLGTCDLASVDHNAKFHKGRIHGTASSVDNIYIVLAHRLCNPDVSLANAAASHFCFGERQTNAGVEVNKR